MEFASKRKLRSAPALLRSPHYFYNLLGDVCARAFYLFRLYISNKNLYGNSITCAASFFFCERVIYPAALINVDVGYNKFKNNWTRLLL